jgi:hypothetical protein
MASRTDVEAARGRPVQGADGRVMGDVSECRDEGFLCDRRAPFRTTWVIRYEDVARIEAEAVVLGRSSVEYMGPSLRSGQIFKAPPAGKKA